MRLLNKIKKQATLSLVCAYILAFSIQSRAQLSGTFTIPGSYATIAAAVTALNGVGVGIGGVTFNVAAGHTETSININITATGTFANPIIFQKNGVGANPLITAAAGTGVLDAIIKLSGTDYITFDWIDVIDPVSNITSNTRAEWGYALLKTNGTDGSQNVSIRNCNITLQKTYTTTVGIYSNNHTSISSTALAVTAISGANSNNKFYGNNISDVYTGIFIAGFNDVTPYTFFDQNNDIGSVTGNTITNFCGGTVAGTVICSAYQNFIAVANNSINGGNLSTGGLMGINLASSNEANATVNSNTITLNPTGGVTQGIYSFAGANGTTNTISIYNNVLQNFSIGASSSVFYIIRVQSAPNTLNIYNNTITGMNMLPGPATYGAFMWIQTSPNTLNINDNNIYNNNYYTTSGGATCMYGIVVGFGGAPTGAWMVYNNNLYNNVNAAPATAQAQWIRVQASSAPTVACYNNAVYNNTFSNILSTGSNVGFMFPSSSSAITNTFAVYSNTVYGLNSNSYVQGIYISPGNPTYTNYHLYDNLIHDLTGGTEVHGIYAYLGNSTGAPGIDYRIHRNRIYNLISNSASATNSVQGMQLVCQGSLNNSVTAYNNMIAELKAPNSSNPNAIIGIQTYAVGSYTNCSINLYYNSISLTAGSTGANFGTSGIMTSNNINVDMINNLIMNTSTPNGSGATVAHRRTSAALTNLSVTTDFNSYFVNAGLGGNRFTYYDGTAYSTLTNYQSAPGIAPREANSLAANQTFTSTTDLHLDVSNTSLQGMGTAISILDDFDGTPRLCTEIGADERWNCLILPVELSSLEINCKNNSPNIEWKTVSEKNNNYFTIERSNDMENFEVIAQIKSIQNYVQSNSYSFLDKNNIGESYYRLSQTDLFGLKKQLGILTSNCAKKSVEFNVYPNPLNNRENLSIDLGDLETSPDLTVVIHNSNGQKCFEKTITANEIQTKKIIINTNVNFSPGFYIISINSNEYSLKKKLLFE